MNITANGFWNLLRYWMTPVDSERFVPERGLLTVGGSGGTWQGIFKAVFWIVVAVAATVAMANL